MCRGEPAPIHTRSCWRSVRSISTRATLRRGNGATAPGSKPVACSTSSASATRTLRAPAGNSWSVASAAAARSSRATRSTGSGHMVSGSDVLLVGLEGPRHGDAALDLGTELGQAELHRREGDDDVEDVEPADVADPED